MKLFYKHMLAFLLLGLAVLTSSSLIFYFQFKNSLIDRTLEQLKSVNVLKKTHIETILQERKTFFKKILDKEKHTDISVKSLKENYGFEEISLHNVKKKTLEEQNLHFKITSGNLRIRENQRVVELYNTINDSLELVFTVPIEKFQSILIQRMGMGSSGESYLVGVDKLMRSQSRFFPDKNPLEITVNTEGVQKVLTDDAGAEVIADYRNIEVLSAFGKIHIDELTWVILSEIDLEETLQPLLSMKQRFVFIFFLILLIVVLISVILSKQLIKRVLLLKQTILELAEGKIPEKPILNQVQDEIDEIAKALIQLIDSFEEAIQFAKKVGNGNFSAEYKLQGKSDQLGTALVQMRDQLDALTKEANRLEKIGKEALVEGQEIERARLAKDIHDGVGPLLTTIKLQLSTVENNKEVVEDLKTKLDDTITEIRRISYNLMPSVLLDFGVGAALKNLIDGIKSTTKISFVNDIKSQSRLTERVNISIYRIAQETLNNALKYADASVIKISITEFEDKVSYFISDDGKGFNFSTYQNEKPFSKGLLNIRERVRLLDGELYIHSDMEGTQIEVEIPL